MSLDGAAGESARRTIDLASKSLMREHTLSQAAAFMINGFDPSTVDRLEPREQELIRRRAHLLGPAYKLMYAEPLEFVRGSGTLMFDRDGRDYLDAYNNVPSVGHAHPRVADAIATQAHTLNTNTRYLDGPLLDYAERLLASHDVDDPRVMFTCTGSEAVDLALRVARFATGGEGVVVTSNAYHGITTAAAEVSPSLGRHVPIGRAVWTSSPPLVDLGDASSVASEFAESIRVAFADMVRHGVTPAALLVDSLFSTDGILPDPAPFLQAAHEVAHDFGALAIADEVQPGFGRTGDKMWGYQRHNARPDLVVLGKPMGNGMPIAGVVVKSELVEEFGAKTRFFNTFGANSVSIAAAAAVLDVLEDERLQENSRSVGAYLRESIEQLAQTEPLIAGVRGAGLYLGIDIGSAAGESGALEVVNEMRRRRVLISATGVMGTILKIRPPLPFSMSDADRLLDALQGSLTWVRRSAI